jgi:hypothetical protein
MASKACLCLAFLLALLALHEAQGLSFTASGEDWSADLFYTLTEAYLYSLGPPPLFLHQLEEHSPLP